MSFFGRLRIVHTVSFLAHNERKDLKPGHCITHLCRYKHCCCPTHLAEGTAKQNALDRIRDGTMRSGSKAYHATTTESVVAKIKATRGMLSSVQRAQLFNVKATLVSAVDNKQSWKDVLPADSDTVRLLVEEFKQTIRKRQRD